MSLPPGFLDELRSRLSLGQVVGRKVMWDNRKSNQAKGDLWSPCPFHQEKTASFHVDDRKGFYYCFGCHAKGDAISFVRETENVGFMEAIEILAGEAGMQMPARDPQAREKADRRSQLADVMEDALRYFRLQLKTANASAARDYLAGRGLDDAARDRFEVGFAPDGWQRLWDHLTGKGVSDDLILGAGLAKPSSKGGKPYDTFRNRIMFPIRDARGRCIAFGGRAMDPSDNAKYLNSPETELFDKGRSLYNHGPAREAAGKGQQLIVAEGYMDVIALVEGGFGASVAPLGTAITENQLELMWRIAPEPVIALDGDTAGLRAAYRLIDLAMPLLEAGRSLRFALMPEGKDPDDLIRAEGAKSVQQVIGNALPLVQLLWRRETEGKIFDSPERKATLDKALRERILTIKDPSLRSHYGSEINRLRKALFQQGTQATSPGRGGARRWNQAPATPRPTTKSSLLVAAGDSASQYLREAVILASVLSAPKIAEEFAGALEDMSCADPVHGALRDAILRTVGEDPDAVDAAAKAAIGPSALETMLRSAHVAVIPCVRNPGQADLARKTVAEELAKLNAEAGAEAEISEAAEDLAALADETVTWRLAQAAQARDAARRQSGEESVEFETGPNGAPIDRTEKSAFDTLLENIEFSKRPR